MSQLPDKTYTISQAAAQIGVHPKTLRRWEAAQKHQPFRTLGNQRRYTKKDLSLLQQLKHTKSDPALPRRPYLTTHQAAQKAGVTPTTIRRWLKQGKIKTKINHLGQKLFSPHQLSSAPAPVPASPPSSTPASQSPTSLTSSPTTTPISWLKTPQRQKLFVYATITTIFLTTGLLIHLYLSSRSTPPASPATIEQLDLAPQVKVAMPEVGNFLTGRITIGSDTGDLSFLDQTGNLFVSQAALISGGLTTPVITLQPSDQPPDKPGRLYLNQTTNNLTYYNGSEWVAINQTKSNNPSIPGFDLNSLSPINQTINLDLGEASQATSSPSLNLTLAGPQSQLAVLGGASQAIITLNHNAAYPVAISQTTKISANLHVTKLIDSDNSSFFLDPSSNDLGLSLAGQATISATLKFSKYGEYLTNSVDNYLVASGGLGVAGSTKYGFDHEGDLTTRDAEVSGLTVNGDLIAKSNLTLGDGDNTIVLSGSTISLTSNSSGNDITLKSADQIQFQSSADTSDYIYLSTTSDSAGLFFSGYVSTDPGIRINTATNELEYRDESESTWTSFDSGMATGWTDGGTDVYTTTTTDRVGIGTTNPSSSLEVVGDIRTTSGSFIDDGTTLDVPDYVFESDYQFLSPVALQQFITAYHHLPGVPSQADINQQGLNLSQFSLTLLAKIEELTLYVLDLYQQLQDLEKLITPLASNSLLAQIINSDMIKPLNNQDLILQINTVKTQALEAEQITTNQLTSDTIVTDQLIASSIKASAIDGLKEKISNLVDQYQQQTATASADISSLSSPPLPQAIETPQATPSSHLALDSIEADFGFFQDYLAVLNQISTTNLKAANSINIGDNLVIASNSISSLDNQLYLQPTGTGSINLLAGLMVLDDQGNVAINGNLSITGQLTANQASLNQLIIGSSPQLATQSASLSHHIATQSALTIYNPIGQSVASIDASGSASFNQLNLKAAGTAIIPAGENHTIISTTQLSSDSQILITFTSDYQPATKYWVYKQPDQNQFTVFVNYPLNLPTAIDWLIIN